VLETALPVKFAATIKEALGIEPPLTPAQQMMMGLPQHVVNVPADASRVKALIVKRFG
jgi:threonine synthase